MPDCCNEDHEYKTCIVHEKITRGDRKERTGRELENNERILKGDEEAKAMVARGVGICILAARKRNEGVMIIRRPRGCPVQRMQR